LADSYTPSNDLTLDSSDADLFVGAGAPEDEAQPDAGGEPGDQTTPEPGQAAGAEPETPDAAKTSADWRQLLEDATDPQDVLTRMARSLSRDDLLRNPVLQGIVGDAADKLERRRAADRQRELDEQNAQRERAERQRRKDEALEAEDLLTLGEIAAEERRAEREQQQRDAEARQAAERGGEYLRTQAKLALDSYVDQQPPEVRAAIAQLAQNPERYAASTWNEGYLKWLDDVVAIKVDHARSQWERGTREAIRKEELGRAEEDEPEATPEIGSGGVFSPSELISQAVWEANRGNAVWRRQNLDRIRRSVAAGAIRD